MFGNWKQKRKKIPASIICARSPSEKHSIRRGQFVNHEEDLLQGRMEQSLIDSSELSAPLNGLYQYAIKNVYQAREVIEVEAMGYKVLGELIDFFMEWVNHPSSGQSQKIAIMLQGTDVPQNNGGEAARLAHMLDYISGMTDSFALETYRKLTGIL